jgi:hypothetical protein
MAYEYDEFVDAMRFGLTMSDRDTTDPIWNMVDEVVNKAKAFDRIKAIHNKNVDEMSIIDTECIEMIDNELERADDER